MCAAACRTGFEALEAPVRAALAQAIKRGNLQVDLTVSGAVPAESVRLNDAMCSTSWSLPARSLRDRIGGEPLAGRRAAGACAA